MAQQLRSRTSSQPNTERHPVYDAHMPDDAPIEGEEGTATMGKLDAISSWIKSNPLIVLAGALTTVFGFVISASNVIPVILKALNRPDCFTYADVYRMRGLISNVRASFGVNIHAARAASIGMSSEKSSAHGIISTC